MAPQAFIKAIASHLPPARLDNETLANRLRDWSAEKIYQKTGIRERRVAAENECASDLAVAAAQSLFQSNACTPESIDVLVFCSQSPDYILPSSSSLIQNRLGLPNSVMAFDINLGCSSYVYGLGVVKALLESRGGGRALLLTGDTYTKYIHPQDRSVVTLFGDAGAATLMETDQSPPVSGGAWLGPFCYGTDGSGAHNLIVPVGACRRPFHTGDAAHVETHAKTDANLFMDGAKVFEFSMRRVPEVVHELTEKAGMRLDDVDYFVFHQANRFMLEALRTKLRIPNEKFVICMEMTGNTVSSTIPLTLEHIQNEKRLEPGTRLMLVGFGVGYSWAGAMCVWR